MRTRRTHKGERGEGTEVWEERKDPGREITQSRPHPETTRRKPSSVSFRYPLPGSGRQLWKQRGRGFGHRQSRFYGAGASTLGSRSCLVVEIFLCPPSTVTASAPPRMPWGLCTGRGEPAVRSPSLPAGKSGSEGERDAGRPPGPFWAL